METTNTFYPVFEPDQVLTSEHLNQLRRYLAAQDRQSRRLLHGIGVVWGLFVSNPKAGEISISKGVGITSMGYLICIEQADCKFYRPYKDKVFTEVNCEMQLDGKYDLFLDKNNKQYDLWELLTAEDEAETEDPQIKHVAPKVEPPAVHKHSGKNRQKIPDGIGKKAAWNKSPFLNKSVTAA